MSASFIRVQISPQPAALSNILPEHGPLLSYSSSELPTELNPSVSAQELRCLALAVTTHCTFSASS